MQSKLERDANARENQRSIPNETMKVVAGANTDIDHGLRILNQQPRQLQVGVGRHFDVAGIAVDELKAQRDRLNTYMLQARFALASIYDRAAARVEPAGDHAAVLGSGP